MGKQLRHAATAVFAVLGTGVLAGGCEEAPRGKVAGGEVLYTPAPPVPSPSPPSFIAEPVCPPDMTLVEGDYCPQLQEDCLTWLEPKSYGVCLEYKQPTKCRTPEDQLEPMRFCIDIYEHTEDPLNGVCDNQGESSTRHLPQVMKSFNEVKELCAAEGKRVCLDTEFTQACRGPENKPFPYGYKRSTEICQTNNELVDWDRAKISMRDPEEVARVSRRLQPVNAYPQCVSDYGVFNTVGGVDDLTANKSLNGMPHGNALKGGHDMGNLRNACTPATYHHNDSFVLHVIGHRCCAEAAPAAADQRGMACGLSR